MNSTDTNWSGKRLGLPATGPGSLAKMGRRILAIFADWWAAALISNAFFHADSFATLATFALMQIAFIATTSASIGQRLFGLRIIRLDGGRIGAWKACVRTLLLCLVIPAAVWDADGRALHDKAAGTALVRR